MFNPTSYICASQKDKHSSKSAVLVKFKKVCFSICTGNLLLCPFLPLYQIPFKLIGLLLQKMAEGDDRRALIALFVP